MYIDEFQKAIKQTRNLGFRIPPVHLNHRKRYINQNFLTQGIIDIFQTTFSQITAEELSRGCIQIHHKMKSEVEKHLGCKAFFTIGSVLNKADYYYQIDASSIESMLSKGMNSRFKGHCWLTLDSMEIVDATLATTMGFAQKQNDLYGQMLAIHPDEISSINSNLKYEPQLIGDAFLYAIGCDPETGIAQHSKSRYRQPMITQKLQNLWDGILDQT